MVKDKSERDVSTSLIFPFLLWRVIHNQIWITLSRYRTAKGNNRILDKGIEFDQVDRERDWYVVNFLNYYFCDKRWIIYLERTKFIYFFLDAVFTVTLIKN
jgi:hypothetical protein